MKLIAMYSVYNGTELLDGSIDRIFDLVDEVVVCIQTISNTGNTSNESERWLKKSRYRNKITALRWQPDLSQNTKRNEVNKHNFMLNYAKRNGFTHFLMMACDHYYDPIEFAMVRDYAGKFDVTVTHMYTYYKHEHWRLDPIEDYTMPFICRVREGIYFHYGMKYPVRTDPSVVLSKYDSFEVLDIMLHHYSMVRTDVKSKFQNAAASIRWKPDQINKFIHEYENAQPGNQISYFGNRTIISVE
jgi:hypothetical protein